MSNDNSASIVSKVWNYPPSPSGLRRAGAHVLKNAGVGYGDYVEQITYLLFLKLADEMTERDRQITRSNRLRQSILAAAFSRKLVGYHHHDQHQKAHA